MPWYLTDFIYLRAMIEKIKHYAPTFLYKFYLKRRERFLAEELCNLKIASQGLDADGDPFIELEGGPVFFGFLPNKPNRLLHQAIKNEIPYIDERCFKVAYEIVDRYLLPRSTPGESFFKESRFKPIRDPLNDFDFPMVEKAQIADRFKIRNGDVILDIGAFTGFGTLKLAERAGKTGKVFAFESFPESLALLRKNIDKNGIKNVTIVPKAVSNFSGKGIFYTGGHTANSLKKKTLSKEVEDSNFNNLEVDVVKIDVELPNVNSVDYINITVNGAEPEVIEGMQGVLEKSKNLRLTTPGWYYREGVKLYKIIVPQLESAGLNVISGKLGRVLAWH